MHQRVSRAFAGCRTRPLTLGFGNARLEGAAGPPRGAGDALAGLCCSCNSAEGSSAAVPDTVLEVYLEHLLIMKKNELCASRNTTLPPENREH